ncbi:thioredoxin domain-containing protein [Thermus thermamylovorans]|uniref:Thioredoxin domain-containing protein n=1 Tax=Thermus thermamylovorans TaxID=2509362 RepID=A0A4Q9AZ51_9DEIN|nr:thioredoxin domain-containing protein [Thermus thermamylovorans]TBH17287.1 thioredoxin domain-containing protein [Thermus thermamylovorans]
MADRLKDALSPYLRAHAGDPVDWYPYGEEAFRRAREEGKPLFLSVGYHTCHWCHVMHRESFQDPEVAALLNAHFVPVKVDREERPDVDAAYMRALVSLTGQGGWPMSLFLTPEGKPFFGGTYFPKEDRGSLPGFRRVLLAVAQAWRAEREGIEREAERLAQALWRSLTPPPGPVPEDAEERALEALGRAFDPEWGGFLPAPKFPQGPLLLYLLALAWRGEGRARGMLLGTLRAMALGGVYDQVGGGFHRYSVDRFWRVPHFEKMLYDNALLARVYLGAHRVFGEPLFLRVARETLEWLLAMQGREGGFFTALDAESEGEEGRYYTWTEGEVREALGEDFPLARRLFALGEDLGGRSILTAWGEEEVRKALGEGFPAWREGVRGRLLAARRRRLPPALDDKVLADWSALAVRALAEAGRLLGEARYLEAARKGVRFLLGTMTQGGLLRHAWREGRLGEEAFLADQSLASLALLELYAATGEWPYLEEARRLAEAAWAEFRSKGTGSFPPLPAREVEEGALPSGESALAEAFWRLGAAFGGDYRERAEALLEERALWLARYPQALPATLLALRLLREGTELALPLPSPLWPEARALYLPLTQVALGPAGALPALEGREPGLAYLCGQGACALPASSLEGLGARLAGWYSLEAVPF